MNDKSNQQQPAVNLPLVQAAMEPVTDVTKQIISSLATSPIILAVVLMAVLLVAGNLWYMKSIDAGQREQFMYLLDHCTRGATPIPFGTR